MNENTRTFRVAHLAARIALAEPKTWNAYQATRLALDVMRLAAKAQTHAERWCNVEGYDNEKGADLLRRAVQRLRDYWTVGDWSIAVHGDPRGACLTLRLPGEREPMGV